MKEQKSNFRWLVLVLLFLNNFMGFFSINSIPPLFMEIVEQIPLTKAEMGSIMGIIVLSSLFFAPLGGGISDRIGCRWAAGMGIIIAAIAGALRAYTESSIGLMTCMFFIGAGLSVFAPNMPKALGIWFPRSELAFVNGISTAGLGLGGAVGMATSASILSPAFGGWRETMLVIAGCLLSMGILWMLLYKDRKAEGSTEEKSQSVLKNFKKVFRVKDIWLLSIFYGLHMVGMMAVITFLPISLQERGVERAGELASIMMGMAVIFNILGGIISDKFGIRKPLLILGTIISGLCVFTFSVLSGIPIIIALVIAGAGIGTLVPILFTLPIEIKEIGPGLAATAVGLLLMVGNTGGFFGPLISGKLMDITGSYIASFIFMGAVLIVAAVFAIPIKDTVRKEKQSEVAFH